ncbi:hypothetical protein [Candidatus Korarchaeum cryptofilum]|jgi:hypothetical protein|uniref:hypothetical protein n=1 Tax=Candidatus Korarchaeum cryptofilum TaxID=498846 RepID=UPI00163BB676|nr:hypothetical protein [Candidatus Korarchaeum cryptofilum]
MSIGPREEKIFKKKYASYLRVLRELNVKNPEEVAALLAVAEILTSYERVDVKV